MSNKTVPRKITPTLVDKKTKGTCHQNSLKYKHLW